VNLFTYSMFPCATDSCGDERWVIPMGFVFFRLIFSPTCALCFSSLVVISWHTLFSSATIAMSSAKSKSVLTVPFLPDDAVFRLYHSSAHDKVDDYNEEKWWKNAALSNPWDNLKEFCVPTYSLDTAAGVVIQCLEDINEPVRNAVVCQNFLQRWPVYTVKCLFVIDEVNNEVLLML